MRHLLFLILCSLPLAACQQSATVRDASSGRYVHLDGRQVELRRALPVAAGKARVFLQQGRDGNAQIVDSGFDQYRPHCAFEIRNVDHGGVTIEPDTFQIVRVQHSLQPVVDSGQLRVASIDVAMVGIWGDRSSYHEGYHFILYSERQPEVMRMSCYGAYAEPPDLAPPTLAEIQGALRGIAALVSAR